MTQEQSMPLHTGPGSTPIPDPTVLTSAALAREIQNLREILVARIEGEVGAINARHQETDKAVILLQHNHERIPGTIDAKVAQLQAVMQERFSTVGEQFRGVEFRFAERDARVEQTNRDARTAIDAALQSAEKAVGKSEVATTKQIDALAVTLQTAIGGLNQQIGDVKERMTRLEATGLGRQEATTDVRAWGAFGIVLVLFLITLVGFIGSFALR